MANFASGKNSKAISDISGAKIPYTQLKTTWDNLRVEPSEYDPKHPQLTPAKNVVDATALRNPRPDNDPENVVINLAFTSNIFLSRVARSQIGTNIHALTSVGTIQLNIEEEQTGVQGTGAIGTVGAGLGASGVAGTTAIGTYSVEQQIDVSVTEVGATSAVGTVGAGVGVSTVQATGGIGSESITHDRIFELPNGGAVGTGAIGTSAPQSDVISSGVAGTMAVGSEVAQSDVIATGVAGTSAIGTFGEEGNGTLNLTVTPTSATGTVNAGTEVAESEIPETNTNGWGEQTWGIGVWGGDEEIRGTGGVGSSTIDIFFGPFPSGVAGTTAIGTYVSESQITESGVAGTGGVGTVTLDSDVPTTGVAGTFAIGTELVTINGGYGEGGWNTQTWGN